MFYLEETKLTKAEQDKFIHWARDNKFPLNELCDSVMTSVLHRFELDVIKLDELLGSKLAEYDPDNCLYKGEPKSLKGVIETVYGSEIVGIITKLTKE